MNVTILGSTGSIGCSTLDVIHQVNDADDQRIDVECLIAGGNVDLLAQQARAANAKIAVVRDESRYSDLKAALAGTSIEVAAGEAAILEASSRPVDNTMAAISGTPGLLPTLAAINAGNTILLANKETMVCAGPVVIDLAKKKGVDIIPVDSEHNAIWQVLETGNTVEKVTLTASGGPFREWTLDRMKTASVADALAHPNWSMGAKNSLDSATLMNKGLELIEAAYLFDIDESQIDVLVHRQSIIHAMVSYQDGSVLAQMGAPDMRIPIAHALGGGSRFKTNVERLDLIALAQLDFEAPDHIRFPALHLARLACRNGALGTSVFNAANERAGEAFLAGRCSFLHISDLVQLALEKALDKGNNEMPRSVSCVDDVLHVTALVNRLVDDSLRDRTESFYA